MMDGTLALSPEAEPVPGVVMTIIQRIEAKPSDALLVPTDFELFLAELRTELLAAPADTTTDKSRKAIASRAFRVTKLKTSIDDAGKALNEEANKQVKAVDLQRRAMRAKMDALQEEVRRPLNQWETAEAERVATAARVMKGLRESTLLPAGCRSEAIAERLDYVTRMELDADVLWGEMATAVALRGDARQALQTALDAAKVSEAAQAELEETRRALKAAQDAAALAAADRLREKEMADRLAEEARVAALPPAEPPPAPVVPEPEAQAPAPEHAPVGHNSGGWGAVSRDFVRAATDRNTAASVESLAAVAGEAGRYRAVLAMVRVVDISEDAAETLFDAIVAGKVPGLMAGQAQRLGDDA